MKAVDSFCILWHYCVALLGVCSGDAFTGGTASCQPSEVHVEGDTQDRGLGIL